MIDGGVYELSGWVMVAIDGRYVESKEDLLDVLAEELKFPDYFGRNWDALNDCLTDLAPAAGYLVVWKDAGGLARSDPDAYAVAVEVLRDAAATWRIRNTPFVVVIAK